MLMLNTTYDRVCVPITNVFGMLNSIKPEGLRSAIYHGPKEKNHKMASQIVQQNSLPYHQNRASNWNTIILKSNQ